MLISLMFKPFALFINFLIGILGGFFGDYQFINHGFGVVLDLIGY